jgi:16S rRNA (uracil1498-N3)-methyltransferase
MAVRSVYVPGPRIQDGLLRIQGDEHNHLAVARVQPGEAIEAFDGNGAVWRTEAVAISKRETTLRVLETRTIPRDRMELIAGLALIRPAAFELALEKVVEIGVARIAPFAANRSNTSAGNRQGRWTRILVEAAKQSKQYILPHLDAARTFDEVISIPAASKIMFAEHDGGPLHSALAGSPVLYLIGPEGGWTDHEISAARHSGFHTVSLGAAILKAETAAIVGTSLIRYELGK